MLIKAVAIILVISVPTIMNMTMPPNQTEMDKHKISELIRGKWGVYDRLSFRRILINNKEEVEVSFGDPLKNEFLGTLIIEDDTYTFEPAPGVNLRKKMRDYVPYIRKPKGKVSISYDERLRPGIGPDTYVEDLKAQEGRPWIQLAFIEFLESDTPGTDFFSISLEAAEDGQKRRLTFHPMFHAMLSNDPFVVKAF